MTIEDKIKESMARYIERNQNLTDVVVTGWDEEFDAYAYEGCRTCGPEIEKEYSVDIYYCVIPFRREWFSYKGKFTDLIKELDSQ